MSRRSDDHLAAIRTRLADPSFGPVASGDVAWLCSEVERLRVEEVRDAEHISRQRMRLSAAEDALADLRGALRALLAGSGEAQIAYAERAGRVAAGLAPVVPDSAGPTRESEDTHAALCDADEALRERVIGVIRVSKLADPARNRLSPGVLDARVADVADAVLAVVRSDEKEG